jgi:hypothetical protein
MQGSFMKLVSRLLVVCMLAVPFSSQAAMIGTDRVVAAQQLAARDQVQSYLARGDVQSQLQAMGVSPETAKDRVAAMTDAEVQQLAGQIQSAPAGANSAWAVAVGIAIIVWVVYYFDYR